MKQILLLTTVLITLSYTGFSQNKIGLKIYQNTDAFSIKYSDYYSDKLSNDSHLNFTRITLAVNWASKRNLIHEVEISIPEIDRPLDNVQFPFEYKAKNDARYHIYISTYSARYELNKTVLKLSKSFSMSTGLGINPYYLIIENKPVDNQRYLKYEKYYGASFYIVPRLVFNISKRFSADLNIPFNLFDIHRTRTRVYNPSIPKWQQIDTSTNNTFFMNAYTVRLGVMFSLNKKR